VVRTLEEVVTGRDAGDRVGEVTERFEGARLRRKRARPEGESPTIRACWIPPAAVSLW